LLCTFRPLDNFIPELLREVEVTTVIGVETGAGVEAAAVIGGSVVTAEAGMGARVIEIDAASKGSMTFE